MKRVNFNLNNILINYKGICVFLFWAIGFVGHSIDLLLLPPAGGLRCRNVALYDPAASTWLGIRLPWRGRAPWSPRATASTDPLVL